MITPENGNILVPSQRAKAGMTEQKLGFAHLMRCYVSLAHESAMNVNWTILTRCLPIIPKE